MGISQERMNLLSTLLVWAQFTPDVCRESLTAVLGQLSVEEHVEKILTPEMQVQLLGKQQNCSTGVRTTGGTQNLIGGN